MVMKIVDGRGLKLEVDDVSCCGDVRMLLLIQCQMSRGLLMSEVMSEQRRKWREGKSYLRDGSQSLGSHDGGTCLEAFGEVGVETMDKRGRRREEGSPYNLLAILAR
jgi:hypothetical protein